MQSEQCGGCSHNSIALHLQELLVCKEAAQPVVEAISKLEASMDAIESIVSKLDLESKHLSDHLKLSASEDNS